MDRGDPTRGRVEREPVRARSGSRLRRPEIPAPAVVVPADHDDGHPCRQPGERRRDAEPASRNDPRVGEPEVEEIAVDQETVAQGGDGVEKGEERFLDGRGRHSEMGVGDDDQCMAEHGAKDGPLLPGRNRCDSGPRPRTSQPREATDDRPRVTRKSASGSTTPRPTRWGSSTTHAISSGSTSPAPSICACAARAIAISKSDGFRLVVSEVCVRYRQPARFDDRSGSVAGCATWRRAGSSSGTRSSTSRTVACWPPPRPSCCARRRHAPHRDARPGSRHAPVRARPGEAGAERAR